MMTGRSIIALLSAATILASCGSADADGNTRTGVAGLARDEAYCNIDGLAPSRRHSFVVIDEAIMKASATPEQFREQNDFIRELLLSVVAPGRALTSGMIAPRERISLVVLPSNGGAGQLLFTGCVPGLTASEQAELVAGTSSFDEFVSGDPLGEVSGAGEEFTASLLAALFAAAGQIDPGAEAGRGAFAKSSLVQSLAASRQLLEPTAGTSRRVFLLSDLSRFRFEDAEAEDSAKSQGIASAKDVGEVLRFSETYLIQPPGAALKGKDYLGGFILGQGARLAYFGSGVPSVATRPPVQSFEFAGRVNYESGPESAQIVLARDDRNNLVYSFFALLGGNSSVTPMSGTMICESEDACKVLSDNSGFAQVWKSQPGAAPQFDAKMPLAGARDFEFQIEDDVLKGEIRDEALQLSSDPTKPGLAVSATRQ